MSITSVRGYQDLYSWWLTIQASSQSSAATGAEETASAEGVGDTVVISDAAKALTSAPPPPPEKMDFSTLSDDELREYVERMQALTGAVPGMSGDVEVAALTSDEMEAIRATLVDISQNARQIGRDGQAPPPPPTDVSGLSDDEIESLLAKLQESYGYIPGVEDSEETDVSTLTERQWQDALTALTAMFEEQGRTIMMNRALADASSAYEAVLDGYAQFAV